MRTRILASVVVTAALIAPPSSARAADPTDRTDLPRPETRVRLQNVLHQSVVSWAREGASRRLGRPECAQVFSDFQDAAGRTLQEALDEIGETGPSYLQLVWFVDGGRVRPCDRPHVLAATHPASRVVAVCPSFAAAWRQDRVLGEIVLIHEMLHTLGLDENPPTSAEITAQVRRRCRRS